MKYQIGLILGIAILVVMALLFLLQPNSKAQILEEAQLKERPNFPQHVDISHCSKAEAHAFDMVLPNMLHNYQVSFSAHSQTQFSYIEDEKRGDVVIDGRLCRQVNVNERPAMMFFTFSIRPIDSSSVYHYLGYANVDNKQVRHIYLGDRVKPISILITAFRGGSYALSIPLKVHDIDQAITDEPSLDYNKMLILTEEGLNTDNWTNAYQLASFQS